MNLVFGVLDVAYGGARGSNGATTTKDVATILEDRYHVMETFYASRQEKIGEWLAESVADSIDSIVNGEDSSKQAPTFAGEQNIEAAFRAFLSANEMASIVVGLTESERDYFLGSTGGFMGAASAGVNHRKKHPFSKKNKARPAFIDTGLYQRSFRAWIAR